MNRQQILSSGLLVGMLVSYWFLLARKELVEIGSLQGEIQGLHATLRACEGRAANLERAQVELDEVSGWLDRVHSLFLIDEADPDFLLEVATALRACRLSPRETSPSPVVVQEPFMQQSIHVVVHGGLEDVLEFLHSMEHSRPFCRVTELRLEPTQVAGEVRADLTMLRLWRVA